MADPAIGPPFDSTATIAGSDRPCDWFVPMERGNVCRRCGLLWIRHQKPIPPTEQGHAFILEDLCDDDD